MKRCVGLVTGMLLWSGAALAAEDLAAVHERPQDTAGLAGSQTDISPTNPATTPTSPVVPSLPQATALTTAHSEPVLQTVAGFELPPPGLCPVITELLQDNCANLPENSGCQNL